MGFDIECIIDIHTYPGEYFCPVCRTLVYPNEALQSQCTHLYCKACLSHVSNGDKACPYDGYLVLEAHSKPLLETNKILAENIGKVKVRCLYHKSGCTWEGILSECTSHCSGCAFGNSPVICNRCGVQIVHRQVHEHAQSCPGVYQSQLPAEVNSNSQSGAPATTTTTAGADQNRQVAQPRPVESQAQNPQASAAPLLPGQDLNQQANLNSQAPAAMATSEQWYQQQYQQYYQQYAGYDPYQQSYQQYYPYQQQGVQQYQQHPSHVQGQTHPQVYAQPQPQQAQSQSYPQVQPQPPTQSQPQAQVPPTQSQPQAQVPPQVQVQPHIQPSATQHQNQSQINQQQLFQPPVQSHAQVPSQSYPPPHGQPPQPYPLQPHPQGVQQHLQATPYQQPSAQMHNAQPPLVLPQQHSQVQPQLSMHPPQSSQPAAPIVQPQNPLQAPHVVTGHQSYPQSQHQMPAGPVASGSFSSGHAQSQVLQQQPMMRPPSAPNANQQQGMLPPQGQFASQQSLHYSNTQYPGLPVQSRPPQAIQQPVSQQYPQQPFAGPFSSQSHQQGPSVQQQPHLHPPGPPHPSHMALQTAQSSHIPVQSQPNVALGPVMHPQPPQNYFGRAMPLAPSGSGAAPPVPTVQHGLNQQPISQSYSNSVNNQLIGSTDQKKSVALERQVDQSSAKPEHPAEPTITSQNNADKDAGVLGTESFETNAVKLETGPSSAQDAMKDCAKSDHTEKGNSNGTVMMQTIKEEHNENALEMSSGAKSADTEVVIERPASGRVHGHFPPHRGFEAPSNTSQGLPSSALPFGSAEIRDGIGSRPLSGPEGHFGPHHTPLNVSESHFGQQHPANPIEAEMFRSRMNGFGRGLPYHTDSSHDERLKVPGVDHPGTLPAERCWPLDQAAPGPFDKGPSGFGYDGNAVVPSRFLPSYHPPGAPYNNDGTEREARHNLLNDERRNADFAHRHTDFLGPGPGFGPEHMNHFAPRSPHREYFGVPPRGFLPRGHASFDDVDGREAQMFSGGSRPFRHPPNPVRNSFHEDRLLSLHRHPRGDMVDEHVAAGPPHSFRGGEIFGNDVPNHLRVVDPLGRQNLPSNLHGEPAGFGPFSGPGNLSHLPFGESFGGNKPAIPRLGEPGFRSRYSLQGVSNEGTYMGDVDSFDRSRNRISLSMGWCRICKVDCETVEGLDMHSQTREHQNMAMDMVRSIKEQNRKRQKNNAEVEEGGKKRNAAIEGVGNKP